MKKIVIAGSAKLQNEVNKWLNGNQQIKDNGIENYYEENKNM